VLLLLLVSTLSLVGVSSLPIFALTLASIKILLLLVLPRLVVLWLLLLTRLIRSNRPVAILRRIRLLLPPVTKHRGLVCSPIVVIIVGTVGLLLLLWSQKQTFHLGPTSWILLLLLLVIRTTQSVRAIRTSLLILILILLLLTSSSWILSIHVVITIARDLVNGLSQLLSRFFELLTILVVGVW
jgi:hypothetical protein